MASELLLRLAAKNPRRVCLVHGDEGRTAGSLAEEAHRVAGWLARRGVGRGDRVMLIGGNGDRLVAGMFGTLFRGAAAVPISAETPAGKLVALLDDCEPKADLADQAAFAAQAALHCGAGSRPVLLTDGQADDADAWSDLDRCPIDGQAREASGDELAFLLYTSGSTRQARAVMCPFGQVRFAVEAINSVLESRPDDVVLSGLPLSFDYGLYQVLLTLHAGARLILQRDWSNPLGLPGLLARHGVTGLPGMPTLFALLLRSRLLERVAVPHLRYLTSTGDVFPPAHVARLRELLPETRVIPMYGLTECKRVSMMPPGCLEGREGSVGRPIPGTSVAVVDGEGRELPPCRVGELVVFGPHLTAGYWKDPEQTAVRFRSISDGRRALYTGDLFHQDNEGFLYFHGRAETVFKCRGHRVSAAEVEAVLCGLPGIAGAAVVSQPDTVVGDRLAAFVIPASGFAPEPDDLLDGCRRQLEAWACPQEIVVCENLPTTANGKLDRQALRQRLGTRRQPEDRRS